MELALCREEAIGISVVDYDLARVRELLPDALTGFADLPIASLMTPKLTTVHQNRVQMARAAFDRLMARIASPDLPPCDIFLPSRLIVRESTSRNKTNRNKK